MKGSGLSLVLAALALAVGVLQSAPQNAVHEALDLRQLRAVRPDELFHDRGQPRAGSALITQAAIQARLSSVTWRRAS